MRRRWLIAAVITAILAVAVGIIFRRFGKATLIPASDAAIAQITGEDLQWKSTAKGPYVAIAAFKQAATDPYVEKVKRLLSSSAPLRANARDIRASWPAVERLVGQLSGKSANPPGPPPRGYSEILDQSTDFNYLSARRSLAKVIAAHIRLESELGNHSRCFRAASAAHAYEMFRRRSDCAGLIDYMVRYAEESILNRAIDETANRGIFSAEELEKLYLSIPPEPPADPEMGAAIRYEWNYFNVPFMRSIQSDKAFTAALSKSGLAFDPAIPSSGVAYESGTFDVPETLRLQASVFREKLANLSRTWRSQDTTLVRKVESMTKMLPEEPKLAPDANSVSKWWEVIKYRGRMNALPNSLGIKILGDSVLLEGLEPSFRRRTAIAAHRLTLLIAMFRSTHAGELPQTLEQLRPFLRGRALPEDGFARGPLRYDQARRVIWSVGPNGVDDGGTTATYKSNGSDIVFPVGR